MSFLCTLVHLKKPNKTSASQFTGPLVMPLKSGEGKLAVETCLRKVTTVMLPQPRGLPTKVTSLG